MPGKYEKQERIIQRIIHEESYAFHTSFLCVTVVYYRWSKEVLIYSEWQHKYANFSCARRKIAVINSVRRFAANGIALFQDFSTQLRGKLAVYPTRVNKSVLP